MPARSRVHHLLLAGTALLAFPVHAQEVVFEGEAAGAAVGDIIVTGSRFRTTREVAAKRDADIVTDSLSSDDIGAVPDFNIPDALRRIAGISTEFDEDEGRFVNVRGIDANLNVVTLDGIALPSSGDFGGTGRAVDLEFLPSTSVKQLQVYKTFTPDLDGGSVGGQVNLVTRSAFDKPGFDLVVRGTASHYELTDIPFDNRLPLRGEATMSTRFGADHQFGLVLTGLYSVRPRDQIKFFSVNGFEGAFANIIPADRFNTSLYGNDQTRFGGNGKFEYRQGGTYAFLSAYWYKQAETETRYVNNLQIRAQDVTETGPATGRAAQAVNNVTADYFPIETQGRGVQIYLDQEIGDRGRLNATAGYGEQMFDHETPAIGFQTARLPGLGFDFDTSGLVQTRSPVNDPALFADPARYTANLARYRDLHTEEGLWDAKASYGWNNARGAEGSGFKLGGEYRRLRRMRDNEQFDLPAAARGQLRLADFLSDRTMATIYQPESFLFNDTGRLRSFFDNADLVRDANASTSADFVYREEIASGFAMGTLTGSRYKLIAGLRYEHTDFSADARDQRNVVSGRFGDWLPSINARFDAGRDTVLRAAYSRTLGRPNPGDLATTTTITEASDQAPVDVIVTRGNPDLKPRRSDNFDLSIEHYFDGGNGMIAAGLFYKNIRGDIFNLRTRGDYQGQSAEFRQNINAMGSKVKGIELSASLARMPFLPGALSGFGVSANMTFIDGSMEIPAQGSGDDLSVSTEKLGSRIRQPNFIANAALFYNRDGFEARVAWNRTASFLTSLTQKEAAYSQVDASLRYSPAPNWQISLEGRNLTSANRTQLADIDDFDFLFGVTGIDRSFHLGATFRY
ncbi:TonB-dependent receptor [Sphingomonas mucosissima]|uniref:Vitamin B12 transporter BtuB n=1 Tax=Sphingomonas mucosissima TaxID=370959 RepID=A0A245ZQJ5_9SPHN|nr:TonB-dependent receptor [Sphingomonas mucosissima]OWK31991.1 vitamin B12 transporter BtuB [Sphingomonas mucosissima]